MVKTPSTKKKAPRARKRTPGANPRKLLKLVQKCLDDDQADDVTVIDLSGKTAFADFMIVASGRNTRHISAMASHLKAKIKTAGGLTPPTEGLNQSEWVLIDGGDVIIHLFHPEIRMSYNLEKMWGGAAWPEDSSEDHPEENPDGPKA